MKDRRKKTRLAVNAKRVNPVKFDPTRTTTLRRAFVGKLRRKFALLRKAIYDLLVTEDALGLKKNLTYNAFCPTGPGGGVDPSCSPVSSGVSSEEWANSISPKEKHLVQEYLRSASWVKATQAAPEFYDQDRINEVKEFEQAILKAPLFKGNIHRGLGGLTEEQVKSFVPGSIISMDSTSSWTKDKHVAEAFVELRKDRSIEGHKGVVLTVKDSKFTHDIEGIGSGAKLAAETLSVKGSKYKVVSVSDINHVEPFPKGHPTSRFQKPSNYKHVVLEEIANSITTNHKPIKYVKLSDFTITIVTNHIEKLPSGKYRLLSHTGKNLGTFDSHDEAAKHEGEVEYFKHVSNERWRFNTTPEQLKAFKEWLKTQVDYYVTGMTDEELWRKFIESGFKKGAGRAFDDTKPQTGWTEAEGAFYAGTKDQFLKSAFGQPESLSKVQLLAARTFDELEGMSADMQNKLGRILVDGLTKGNGPISIAREMSNQLNLSMTRAETIARTELIRAHAEGQLAGMEELGVDEVGVMVEWSTAGDDRVCELCEPMEGVVLKIEEARGMIPRHPNCRCAFVPANVAEPTDDQKRGKRKIMSAVRTSAALGKDDFSTAVPVTKERPKSVLPVIANAFCPTGPGGGQDNSCSPFSTSAVDFGDDVSKQYKDAPKIRVTDEDVSNVKAALKQRGMLNKDGTVTLYHDTIDDPETIASILKHGLIPSAQPAPGQTWKATHSSYSTYFHQDPSAARGLQSTAADEFLTTIEARIPVTKEFLKRVIPDEESGGVHEGVVQLISGAGAPAVIGGVPAKYLSSRKYSKPTEPKPTKTSRTTHPHEDSILQAAGELNGSKYKGRLSIGERISSKLYKESGKKINLSGAEVNEVLKQHSSELSKYGISINTQPAPSVVYQFSQLLAGARK